MRYAEDMNYYQTVVHPAVSQGEISELLENFGADAISTTTAQIGGQYAMMVRFQWEGKSYRFTFTPLVCKNPERISSFGGKKRTALEQSRYQMGRIAAAFVKSILTAADTMPSALFGFLELPGVSVQNGLPITAGEMDPQQLAGTLSLPSVIPQTNIVDGEIVNAK
jgi:hypothetical protein